MAAVSGYDGFISYSHRHDAVLGPVLQASIARFAKPWYRMRALRIFVDTADLSANPGLWPSIEDALNSSQWFILLASAEAAESDWVNREVQWWIANRSPGRLLVVGTSPGLAWDEQTGDWAADAPVPPALRGAFADEPRWVDLSTVRLDSGRPVIPPNDVAAVAAPLRGRHLDELVGEHLRQHRRAMHLAGGAVAVMALLTALAVVVSVVAIGERNSAIREQTISLSRQLAAESLAVDSTDPLTARQLAVAAWSVYPTDQAELAMSTLLAEQLQDGICPPRARGVNGVAFSPDGKLLASADDDGTVRLWNPATGQAVGKPLSADKPVPGELVDAVNGVAFSPDGKLLASAGNDGTVRLWNPATGQPIGSPLPADTGADGGVNGVAFSPDGKLLASADADGTVRLWNPATGQPVGSPLPADAGPSRRRERGGVQPGRQAAGQRRRRRHGPAVEPGHRPARRHTPPRRHRPGGGVDGVAFSPDGKLLASADADGTVRLWNPATGQPDRHTPPRRAP